MTLSAFLDFLRRELVPTPAEAAFVMIIPDIFPRLPKQQWTKPPVVG